MKVSVVILSFLVLLQAFDLGTLVIARDIPGNANLIHHNLNGFLYKTPQVNLLNSLIQKKNILKSSDIIRSLGP